MWGTAFLVEWLSPGQKMFSNLFSLGAVERPNDYSCHAAGLRAMTRSWKPAHAQCGVWTDYPVILSARPYFGYHSVGTPCAMLVNHEYNKIWCIFVRHPQLEEHFLFMPLSVLELGTIHSEWEKADVLTHSATVLASIAYVADKVWDLWEEEDYLSIKQQVRLCGEAWTYHASRLLYRLEVLLQFYLWDQLTLI